MQPLLPYARALVARGHEVAVAAPIDVSETLCDGGFRHFVFDRPGDDVLGPIWARMNAMAHDEAAATAIAAGELFGGVNAVTAVPKLQLAISTFGPQLIVRDSVEYGSLVAAELAKVRHARVAVHSISFEEALPPSVAAPLDALRASVGLAPDAGASLSAEPVFSSFPASLDIAPVSSRMRAAFRARVVDEAPSGTLADWAQANDARPLVYITFGSILGGIEGFRSIYRIALDALEELPVRALLTTGRALEPGALGAIPANVHVEAWVPQRDVLPRAAALVCHGGSGTLLGGLAAGLPMVIAGVGADQPHNGRLVARAGAGLALTKPDAGALRAAIQSVLETRSVRAQAQKLADEIAAMPTVENAVDQLLEMS